MSRILLLFLILIPLLFPVLTGASSGVLINEIAWMGTKESPHDEWIELYNNSSTTISIEGWILKISNKEIRLKGKIEPNSYFILERTDETTLPDIKAGQIYSGSLQNSGENLILINANKKTVDQIDCRKGWFEGENESKRTMERKDDSWQTSSKIEGTPKGKNSEGYSDQRQKHIDLTLADSGSIRHKNFTLVLLVSFLTAIFSAIIVLLIDKKTKKL